MGPSKRPLTPQSGQSSNSCLVPADHAILKEQILFATQQFLTRHGLRLKIRKLPLTVEDGATKQDQESSKTNSSQVNTSKGADKTVDSSSTSGVTQFSYPLYHFVTRQKQHMNEQLLRNRSQYMSPFNSLNHPRNIHSPFILRSIPEHLKENLNKMANDFDDPEFSGVWLSLHTKPFLTDTEFGNIARSKIVGWGLIEVLTTNERCLKALWVHPKLCSRATTDLLRGFLPRVMLEAFELPSPSENSCDWKFFYTWVNDFDSLPRQAWLLLTSHKWLGLPKHFDHTAHPVKSHADCCEEIEAEESDETSEVVTVERAPAKRVVISTSVCGCGKNAKWERIDDVLVGCSEASMYTQWKNGSFAELIPSGVCKELRDDADALPRENQNSEDGPEFEASEIRAAELAGLNDREVGELLAYIYGEDEGCGRIKNVDDYVISMAAEQRKRLIAKADETYSTNAVDNMTGDGRMPAKRQRKVRIKE